MFLGHYMNLGHKFVIIVRTKYSGAYSEDCVSLIYITIFDIHIEMVCAFDINVKFSFMFQRIRYTRVANSNC